MMTSSNEKNFRVTGPLCGEILHFLLQIWNENKENISVWFPVFLFLFRYATKYVYLEHFLFFLPLLYSKEAYTETQYKDI